MLPSCNNEIPKRDICYQDLLKFLESMDHGMDGIISNIDNLNACFIASNPNCKIFSTVLVKNSKQDNFSKFMESITTVNNFGLVEVRESKIWLNADSGNDTDFVRWRGEYYYDNNNLIKQVELVGSQKTVNVIKKKSLFHDESMWSFRSIVEIERDSTGKIRSRTEYRFEDSTKHKFSTSYYVGNEIIDEYENPNIFKKIRTIREKDSISNTEKESVYRLSSGPWRKYYDKKSNFSKTNRIQKIIYSNWSDGYIFNKAFITYSYDNQDRLMTIKSIHTNFDSLGNTEPYPDSSLRYFEYNENGYISKIEEKNNYSLLFNYKNNGFIKELLYQYITDTEIDNYLKMEQTYLIK